MKKFKKIWGAGLVSAVLAGVLIAGALGQAVSASGVNIDIWSNVTLESDTPVVSEPGEQNINFTLTGFTAAEARLFVGNKTAAIKIPDELIGKISASGDATVNVKYELVRAFFDELGLTSLINVVDSAATDIADLLSSTEALGLSANLDEVYAALNVKNFFNSIGNFSIMTPITVSDDGKYFTLDFEDAAFKQFMSLITDAVANVGNAIDAFKVSGNGKVVPEFIAASINLVWAGVQKAYDFFEKTVNEIMSVPKFLAKFADLAMFRTTAITLPTLLTTDYSFFETYAPQGLSVDVNGTITDRSFIDISLWSNPQDFTTITFADIVAPDAPIVNAINGTEANGYVINTDHIEQGVTITVVNAKGDELANGTAGPVDLVVAAGAASAEETLYLHATDAAGNKSDSAIAVMPKETATADETGTNGDTPNTSGLPVTGDDKAVFGILGGLGAVTAAAYFLIRKNRKNL